MVARCWHEGDARSRLAQDGANALVGLAGADGQEGAAGLQHGEGGNDLLPALLHDDGDELVGGTKDRLQLVGQGEGALGKFAEAQGVIFADDGGSLGMGQGGGEHGLVQKVGGQRPGGGIDAGDQGAFGGRDERPVGCLPGRVRGGKFAKKRDEGRKHGAQQAIGKEASRGVPVDPQAAIRVRRLYGQARSAGSG